MSNGLDEIDKVMITLMFAIVTMIVVYNGYANREIIKKQIIQSCELIAVAKEEQKK